MACAIKEVGCSRDVRSEAAFISRKIEMDGLPWILSMAVQACGKNWKIALSIFSLVTSDCCAAGTGRKEPEAMLKQ